ncbi:hypothetical protein HT118_04885 [Escherichia coli]|nr:hypothetical protein [Escherichia coli]
MKKLKTPNNRGLGVLGADKVLVVFCRMRRERLTLPTKIMQNQYIAIIW